MPPRTWLVGMVVPPYVSESLQLGTQVESLLNLVKPKLESSRGIKEGTELLLGSVLSEDQLDSELELVLALLVAEGS